MTFRTRKGEEITFKSEAGDVGDVSRYTRGQTLAVRYDPEGEFTPMLDSWSGVWRANEMGVIAGGDFPLGAFLVFWAFGDRLLVR